MYLTQCPVCRSELAINARRVVHLSADDLPRSEVIYTCLVCGSDVVSHWFPEQRAAEPAGERHQGS